MEIRETVKGVVVAVYVQTEVVLTQAPAPVLKQLFADNTDEELLRYGIPAEWLNDVKKSN